MEKKIKFWTYLPEHKREKKNIYNAIERVFDSGQLILGEEVKAFEKEFARFCGVKHGIGVNSGTDALFIALKTLGIGPGDEVITPSNGAVPTVSAICATGATPVFVDIKEDTLLMDSTKIEEVITKRTKCILPVHLYGQCADMDAIGKIARKHNLFVLEDCAQAAGAAWKGKRAGSMSDIAAFSFYPTKILGAYGDGGMIVTNSNKFSEKARMFRQYGIKSKYYAEFLGYNSRLDELQAAILRYKLRNIQEYIDERQRIAHRYCEGLSSSPVRLPETESSATHVYHLFIVRHEKRDEIVSYMQKHNIEIGIHYPYPLHLMKAFRFLGYKRGDFPITEQAASEIVSLPLFPGLKHEDQDYVIDTIQKFFTVVNG